MDDATRNGVVIAVRPTLIRPTDGRYGRVLPGILAPPG